MSAIPVEQPGIYAFTNTTDEVVYVGMTGRLRDRLRQHFILEESSATTRPNSVRLNVDKIKGAVWWEHPRFVEKVDRTAAELIAFDVFSPVLRSQDSTNQAAKELSQDAAFRAEMTELFEGPPSGQYSPVNLDNLHHRINSLEGRLKELERDNVAAPLPAERG